MRGSWRSWRRTRPAVARVRRQLNVYPPVAKGSVSRSRRVALDQRYECRLEVLGYRARQQPLGAGVGQNPTVAHEKQPLTALGFVHDVAGDEQGGPGGRQLVKKRPQAPPQQRVKADRWFVEHKKGGRTQESSCEGHARPLATR